jgi:hypothetical protein
MLAVRKCGTVTRIRRQERQKEKMQMLGTRHTQQDGETMSGMRGVLLVMAGASDGVT